MNVAQLIENLKSENPDSEISVYCFTKKGWTMQPIVGCESRTTSEVFFPIEIPEQLEPWDQTNPNYQHN